MSAATPLSSGRNILVCKGCNLLLWFLVIGVGFLELLPILACCAGHCRKSVDDSGGLEANQDGTMIDK